MASRRVTIEFLGDDKSLSKTAKSVDTTTSKLGDTFKRVGKTAAIGLGVGVAAAGAALVAFGKGAVAEAREAQKIGAQTEAVIKSTGGAANVTAAQVGKLAEALSYKAGIDDEVIQSGSNVLLTFKNIRNEVGKGNDIFNQATGVALDMSVALGQDMKSASILVGKALNDPIAGLSALSRVGVSFTEKQKKVIEGLVKSGDTMKAQKLILRELNSEFAGSAEAQATAGDKAKVAWGNFQEFIGSKLLPLLDKLAVFFVEVIIPALRRFAAWFEKEGIPVIRRFVAMAQEKIGELVAWFKKNWPEIRRVAKEILTNLVEIVKGAVVLIMTIWNKWGDDLFRVLKPILKSIIDGIRNALKVIRGVIELVTGLIKGDWGQAWRGIRMIFDGVWDQMKNQLRTVLKIFRVLIQSGWDAVKDIFKRAWDGIKELFGRAWDGIKNLAKSGLDFLRDRFMDYVGIYRKAFTAYFDIWKSIWTKVFDFAKSIWSRIRGAFDAGVKGIGRVWDKLKGLAAKPVNFVIGTVYNNGIRKALNLIPGVDLGAASLVKFNSGGWTGPGGEHKPAGLVHADEFVIKKRARQKLERTRPGLLDHMNETGAWPGYRIGGRVAGALSWAKSQDYQPYKWGGMGFGGWDCSGFMSGITNFLRGNPLHGRVGSTASFPWSGFKPGPGLFTIGSTPNYGGSGVGHMAGTLAGVNVESRGGEGVVIGRSARGYGDPFFTEIAHLGPESLGSALGLSGSAVGDFGQLFGSYGRGALGAVDAIPDFLGKIKDLWDKVGGMKSKGGFWPLFAKAAAAGVSGAKTYGLDKLKDAGAWLRDEAMDLTTSTFGKMAVRAHDAWSGISGAIPGLADGGIVTKPTIALVGEKGPEAIIPLKNLKSEKHKKGFEKAGGDFIRAVDRGLMSEKELRRLMAHADKIVERLKNRLSTAMDKLRSSLEARKSVVQSVTGGFTTSIFGASGADGNQLRTAGAILSFAQTQRDQARRVTAAIRKLVKKGLSKSLIRQMLSAGESGQAQLMALANQADPAQIDILNRFNEQRLDALHAGGMAAGNALFGDQIRRRRHNVADLRRDLRRAERRADRLHDVIKVDVFIDGKQIEQSQVRLKRRNGGRLAYL